MIALSHASHLQQNECKIPALKRFLLYLGVEKGKKKSKLYKIVESGKKSGMVEDLVSEKKKHLFLQVR